jgi:hypothetical protein
MELGGTTCFRLPVSSKVLARHILHSSEIQDLTIACSDMHSTLERISCGEHRRESLLPVSSDAERLNPLGWKSLTTLNNVVSDANIAPKDHAPVAAADPGAQEAYQELLTMFQADQLLDYENFDVFELDSTQQLAVFLCMFQHLGFIDTLGVTLDRLVSFFHAIKSTYHSIPYHNFYHALDVTVTCFYYLERTRGGSFMTDVEKMALLLAALGHDCDHGGFNNTFHINCRSELALRYNNMSVLENHHASLTVRVMSLKASGVLDSLSPEMRNFATSLIIQCILGTDLAVHSDLLAACEVTFAAFDKEQGAHRTELARCLLHAADVSNPTKNWELCQKWTVLLSQEFLHQSAVEKELGVPPSSFMLPARMTCNFIDYMVEPFYNVIALLIPEFGTEMVTRLRRNRRNWQPLLEEEEHLTPREVEVDEAKEGDLAIEGYQKEAEQEQEREKEKEMEKEKEKEMDSLAMMEQSSSSQSNYVNRSFRSHSTMTLGTKIHPDGRSDCSMDSGNGGGMHGGDTSSITSTSPFRHGLPVNGGGNSPGAGQFQFLPPRSPANEYAYVSVPPSLHHSHAAAASASAALSSCSATQGMYTQLMERNQSLDSLAPRPPSLTDLTSAWSYNMRGKSRRSSLPTVVIKGANSIRPETSSRRVETTLPTSDAASGYNIAHLLPAVGYRGFSEPGVISPRSSISSVSEDRSSRRSLGRQLTMRFS